MDGFEPISLIFVFFFFLECGIFVDLLPACTDIPAESSFAAGERMSELVKVCIYSLILYIFHFDKINQIPWINLNLTKFMVFNVKRLLQEMAFCLPSPLALRYLNVNNQKGKITRPLH